MTFMSIYRFNEKGSTAFANALAELARLEAPADADFAKIQNLSAEGSLIEAIDERCSLPEGPFGSRHELCLGIYFAIKGTSLITNFDSTDSFWSWISARYFDELTCFTSKDGSARRKLSKERESPAYIWSRSYKKAYRHRLGHGIFMIHHLGEVLAKPMLLSHPGSMSDYCEQTFARVGSYREKAVIEAAHSIYYDGEKVLPGASSERRWALRHLHREVAQCLINYEMHEMTTDELLAFLPTSFRDKGFKAWSHDARMAVYLIHALPDSWYEMFDIPEAGSIQWLANRVGCTKRDLDQTLAELKVLHQITDASRGWLEIIDSSSKVHGLDVLLRAIASVISGDAKDKDLYVLSSLDLI